MADGARVKQDQVSGTGGEGTREVWITSGGRTPESSVTVTGARAFLIANDRFKKGVASSNGDGIERRIVSLRKVSDPYIQEMTRVRQFDGRRMEDDMLLSGYVNSRR